MYVLLIDLCGGERRVFKEMYHMVHTWHQAISEVWQSGNCFKDGIDVYEDITEKR